MAAPKSEVGGIKIGFCFEDSYQNGGNLGCFGGVG